MRQSSTILLVDDTPDLLFVLGDLLESVGYVVLYAESGESAVQRALSSTPDLILLDIHMPELDGYATCRILKSLAALRDVPVLFMSTYWDQQALRHIQAVGGADFIRKPFQQDELLAKISAHCVSHFNHEMNIPLPGFHPAIK